MLLVAWTAALGARTLLAWMATVVPRRRSARRRRPCLYCFEARYPACLASSSVMNFPFRVAPYHLPDL
jgi:hypothetical protein